MTTRFFVAILAVLVVVGMCGYALDAEAARFGGGRSFGGSSSFSKPFSSSRVPSSSMRNPSAAQQQPGAAAAAPGMSRPGFGMMGGVLGGLLAGSLLGSLISGNGFGGGGMLDILLIGVALFVLFKLLGRWRAGQQGQQAQTGGTGFHMPVPDRTGRTGREQDAQPLNYQGQQGSMWDNLSGRTTPPAAAVTGGEMAGGAAAANPDVPAGFGTDEFLRGAKMAYERMNASWDKRDLDDIAQFTTSPMMAEVREQAVASPTPEQTELMLVNASLVSVLSEAGREMATVYFDVLLREDPRQSNPTEVREVWHFVRAANSTDMWKLDGIQQVE